MFVQYKHLLEKRPLHLGIEASRAIFCRPRSSVCRPPTRRVAVVVKLEGYHITTTKAKGWEVQWSGKWPADMCQHFSLVIYTRLDCSQTKQSLHSDNFTPGLPPRPPLSLDTRLMELLICCWIALPATTRTRTTTRSSSSNSSNSGRMGTAKIAPSFYTYLYIFMFPWCVKQDPLNNYVDAIFCSSKLFHWNVTSEEEGNLNITPSEQLQAK